MFSFNVDMTTCKKSIIFYTIHFTHHKQPFLFVSPSLSNYKFNLPPLHHLQNIFPSFQNFCFYLQMDHLCIRDTEIFYNFDLVANGRIIEKDEGVHFICPSAKFICIPYNCSFSHLKEKVCGALGLQDQTTLTKLYYCQPQLTRQGKIRYDVVQILTNENVFELLRWKSQFPFVTMIELYAKLTRSAEEILSLLNAPITSNSSVNQDPINSTKAIIYYGVVMQ